MEEPQVLTGDPLVSELEKAKQRREDILEQLKNMEKLKKELEETVSIL